MHSTLQRLSNVSALATTVLLSLLSAIALSSFVIPSRLPPASLALSHLNVVLGRPHHDRFARDREYAFVKFDLDADLAPLFHWNTKQVFVYLAADYSTPDHPDNTVVVWDRIVRSRRTARLRLADAKQKYEFKDLAHSFGNTSATFALHYQVQPYVGALRGGEVVRTEPVAFPPVKRRSQ
ncbi:signal peptidase 22kDa subunit [Rhodotorula diobovata]|uniref:Signal peptidase subunit 3 n=1 Tax=Rhodotorula diobovata TaxID=5288 RepID=A0A5C5G6A7_9BASI|nr:signal peptidase 22kDa subunit [Rhodotorula diobovata]